MGIPKFAAWLTRKFPNVVAKQCPPNVHGLYIDMNGIIHPCCHSEDDPSVAERSEEEKIEQVCLCVDHLVQETRPTTVLYLAMDGVAPRAKMNQQRARRYMSAVDQFGTTFAPEEHGFTKEERETTHRELEAARQSIDVGMYHDAAIPPLVGADGTSVHAVGSPTSLGGMGAKSKSIESLSNMFPDVAELVEDFKHAHPMQKAVTAVAEGSASRFDSNCISPGTSFMTAVSVRLAAFTAERMASDAAWQGLSVILSDTNTPGEGEHKLIDFMRTQISYASDDSSAFNFRHLHGTAAAGQTQERPAHVICGLDADLILLCLSLHAEGVTIMRDVKRMSTFGPTSKKGAPVKKRRGTSAVDGPHDDDEAPDEGGPSGDDVDPTVDAPTPPPTASVAVPQPPSRRSKYEYFTVDLIGNHIVSEMRALCYATEYVVRDPTAFAEIVSTNGYRFRGITAAELAAAPGTTGRRAATASPKQPWNPCTSSLNFKVVDDFVAIASLMGNDFLPRLPSAYCGESAMDNFLEVYVRCVLPYGFLTAGRGELDLRQLGRLLEGYAKIEAMLFRKHLVKSNGCDPSDALGPQLTPADDIYRGLYFATTTCKRETLGHACSKYIEGLRFVWQYYSCTSEYCSWSWFYPQHHAPFAYDLAAFLAAAQWDARKLPPPPTEKYPPSTFAQLLSILPPTSSALLPKPLRDMMWHPPEPLRSSFPAEWAVDYAGSSGKEHLATVLIPFADMPLLQAAVATHAPLLDKDEQMRAKNRECHLLFQCLATDDGAKKAAQGVHHHFRGMAVGDDGSDAVDPIGLICLPPAAPMLPNGKRLVLRCISDVAPSADFRPRTYASTLAVRNIATDGDDAADAAAVPSFGRNRRSNRNNHQAAAPPTSATRVSKVFVGMPLGDFVVASTAIVVGAVTMMLFGVGPGVIVAHPLSGAVGALAIVATWSLVGMLSFALLASMGAAASLRTPPSGCGIRRNQTRDAFVDWLCGDCLSMNFMRNDRCFQCRSGGDAVTSWAVFSGKLPQQPPPFDANHSPHLMWAQIPQALEVTAGQPPEQAQSADDVQVGSPSAGTCGRSASDASENCEMV